MIFTNILPIYLTTTMEEQSISNGKWIILQSDRVEKNFEFISETELEILNTNFKLFATDTKPYGSSHWPVHDVVEPQKAYPQPWLNSWDSEWGLKRVTGIFAQITEKMKISLRLKD